MPEYDFEDDDDWIDDDEDDDYWGDDEDVETLCGNCLRSTCGDVCDECGVPLCHMCAECGANFCDKCPTENYRPAYAEEEVKDEGEAE